MVGLLLRRHLRGKAGDQGVDFKSIRRLNKRGEDVARGNDEQRDVLAEAFGDRDGLGEEHLLEFAEQLMIQLLGPPAPIMRAVRTTTSCWSVSVRESAHFNAKGFA